MDNVFYYLRQLHQKGDFALIENYIEANEDELKKAVDDSFLSLESLDRIGKEIDDIYLLINSLAYENEFRKKIVSRLFNYYTSYFAKIAEIKDWHSVSVALDIFSTNSYIFTEANLSTSKFVKDSLQLLREGKGDVGSDLEIAIDCFIMMVFNTEPLKLYRSQLLEFAARNPGNIYSSDILELE